MDKKIWLSSPHIGDAELEFVKEAFDTNWITSLGPHVDAFENDLCKYTNSPYAAALSSGTAALHLALILLGVERDDVVICQSFTFSASANPIVYIGAKPIFIDSELQTWNMNPVLMEQAIKEGIRIGKKPKAIIVVHLYGMPAAMDEIIQIAAHYEIPVVEDAAEALGSLYHGRKAGSLTSIGILSFNGNKIITTSGGGALLSNKKEYVEQAKFLATQARDAAPHYQHSHIGYNYRMSNVSAAIGRGQMMVLEDRIAKRRANFEFYKSELSQIDAITFLDEPENYFSNRWLTAVTVEEVKTKKKINRETIRLALLEKNIESRPLWKPLHLQPVFEHYLNYDNGIASKLFDNGLCLPSGSNLSLNDLERITDAIKTVFA